MTRKPKPNRTAPFRPEGLAALRARYPAAVAAVYSVAELEAHQEAGTLPVGDFRNVFDFRDGLRLIILKEDHGRGGVLVHASASLRPGCRLDRDAAEGRLAPGAVSALALIRFRKLSRLDGPAQLDWSYSLGIPHWYIEDPGR